MFDFIVMVPTIAFVLFGIGIVLAVIEMCIPGFGFAGIGACICFGLAIIFAAQNLAQGIIFTLIVLAVIAVLIVVFLILLSKGKFSPKLVLKVNNTADLGFSGTADYSYLSGSIGTAETALRPAGRASIDGRTYDVVSDGEFIEKGDKITVTQVSGNRIVVNKTAQAVLN